MAVRVPQEVADRRRQKAKDKAKSKGRTPSQAYLALLDWTLFVTNVPAEMLSGQQVATLYRVRWQVELVFKLWKSYCLLALPGSWQEFRRVLLPLIRKNAP